MRGCDQDVREHLARTARGSRNNVILFAGRDISLLFGGNMDLRTP